MTTKFLTIKFAKFPNFIVMAFPRKNSVFGQFSVNFPLPNPLQNENLLILSFRRLWEKVHGKSMLHPRSPESSGHSTFIPFPRSPGKPSQEMADSRGASQKRDPCLNSGCLLWKSQWPPCRAMRLRVRSRSRMRLRIAASIAILFRACFKGVLDSIAPLSCGWAPWAV